uniref:Zona pellucida sperm-binding protein 3 n=1 Tax=Otus sunia TaxID=257818 RepID=A0A8C8E9M3_9STRI
MGSRGSLGFVLFCWVLAEAVSYSHWGFPQRNSGVLRAAAPLHPVAVQCQEAQMVVTVHRDLFGTGRLVKVADLTLGSAACLPVAQSVAEGTVTFVAGLHECGSTLQMTPDSLIYKTILSYKPTSSGNLVIVRTNAAVVPIECHYPRKSNVSSNAIQPTWAPFRSTLSAEERLMFSLRLMNDDWSTERISNGFQLGESLHLQADVASGDHVPLRLFVDDCVATLSPDRKSFPRYALIDLSGCLVDGRSDDTTSAFISPRPRQETLQFMVDAFKFVGDDRNLIYITCHLKVSPADQAPDPLNKACSFNKASSLWAPVEGTGDICSCCETGNCPLYGGYSRRTNPLARWPGRRLKRDISSKQVVPVLMHHPPGKPSPGVVTSSREATNEPVVGPKIWSVVATSKRLPNHSTWRWKVPFSRKAFQLSSVAVEAPSMLYACCAKLCLTARNPECCLQTRCGSYCQPNEGRTDAANRC